MAEKIVLDPELKEKDPKAYTFQVIKKQLAENPVVIYMKGTPKFPSCGFSARAVEVLIKENLDFAFVDVLQNPEIRRFLPEYGDWPTFPQLWIDGELEGGCDIMLELARTGELRTKLEAAIAKHAAANPEA